MHSLNARPDDDDDPDPDPDAEFSGDAPSAAAFSLFAAFALALLSSASSTTLDRSTIAVSLGRLSLSAGLTESPLRLLTISSTTSFSLSHDSASRERAASYLRGVARCACPRRARECRIGVALCTSRASSPEPRP